MESQNTSRPSTTSQRTTKSSTGMTCRFKPASRQPSWLLQARHQRAKTQTQAPPSSSRTELPSSRPRLSTSMRTKGRASTTTSHKSCRRLTCCRRAIQQTLKPLRPTNIISSHPSTRMIKTSAAASFRARPRRRITNRWRSEMENPPR